MDVEKIKVEKKKERKKRMDVEKLLTWMLKKSN